MALSLNESIRNAHLNSIRDHIDAGTGNGVIRIYAGTQPSPGGTATQLLGTCTFSKPSAPDAANGTITFADIAEDEFADIDGEATWARFEDSDGNWVADLDVGVTGSGAGVEMNTTTIVKDGPIRVNTAQLTAGN